MSQPFDDSDEEMQVALEVSKDDSHDADSIKVLRLSLREKREREKEALKKEATRKGKRKEFEVAEVAARAVDPDSETEASKQAFRKMKEEINLISSDEEAAPVAAVGDGKKRAGARPHVHVAMGVRVEAPRAAPSQHAPRVERGAWRPEQRLSWSAEGQCEGSTAQGERCALHVSSQYPQADPLRRGERFCRHHAWQGRPAHGSASRSASSAGPSVRGVQPVSGIAVGRPKL